MKITITGYDQSTHRVDYSQQSLVKGSITGTYSSARAVEKSIATSVLEHLGGRVASANPDNAIQPEQYLLGVLYATHYQGSFSDLVGKTAETPGDLGNMVWERAKAADAVELPTEDDLAYIEQNARVGVLYEKLTGLKKMHQSRDVFMVWVRKMAADPSQACTYAASEYLSLTQPKPGPVWVAQGDADHYCLLDESGHWVAAIHLNGAMSTAAQEEWLDTYFQRGQ